MAKNTKQNKEQEYSHLPITTYTMIVVCIFASVWTRDSIWIGFKAALLLTFFFLIIYWIFPKPRVGYSRWILHVGLMMILVWFGVWMFPELLNRWLWKPLRAASLANARILAARFHKINLVDTNFNNATMMGNSFSNVDLSLAKGLESVRHFGSSTIGIDTLYKSAGKIPESFLRECGIPDDFITFIPSLIGAQQAIQFYSCFISYSTKDEEFARRLYSRMRDEHLRVWFAPEDIKGG